MRVHTYTVIDIETGRVLEDVSYEYSGPVALAWGGGNNRRREERERQKRLAEQAERDAALARQRQAEQYAALQRILSMFGSADGPGGINKFQQGAYWKTLDDISRVYGSLRESGLRALNRSGFGRAPSGARVFTQTSRRDEAQEKARTLWNALQRSGEDLKWVGGVRGGLTGEFGRERGASIGQASDISQRRFGMDSPSTFSRIMSGLGTVASIVGAPFTGGASLLGLAGQGLGGLFRGGSSPGPAASTVGGGWGSGGLT